MLVFTWWNHWGLTQAIQHQPEPMRFISTSISRLEEAQEAVHGRDGGSLQKELPASACTNSLARLIPSLCLFQLFTRPSPTYGHPYLQLNCQPPPRGRTGATQARPRRRGHPRREHSPIGVSGDESPSPERSELELSSRAAARLPEESGENSQGDGEAGRPEF